MIYVILYSKELFTGVFNTHADDVYYTDKIRYLSDWKMRAIDLSMTTLFLRDNHTIAEIIGLEEAF